MLTMVTHELWNCAGFCLSAFPNFLQHMLLHFSNNKSIVFFSLMDKREGRKEDQMKYGA